MNWTNRYSRAGDLDSSTLETKELTIVVHKHIHYPGEWRYSCHDLNLVNQATTPGCNVQNAQAKAVDEVEALLERMLGSLRGKS